MTGVRMKEKNVNTPYDDVFRTLLNDCPDLIIPVLNEAFGTSFIIGRDMVRKGDNKFFFTKQDGVQKEIVSDSHIMVGGKMFHIECQSSADGSMAVRMFEYDVQIAMQHAELDEGKILDMSGKVIKSIARKNRKTAERIGDIMGGKILEYEAKTIMNEGRAEGQIRVFMNMIRRGYSVKDAMSLAELSQEQADEALAKLQDAKDQADFKG